MKPVVTDYRPFAAFLTLFDKEVLRFRKIALHAILAPILTSILYLLVFGEVLKGNYEKDYFTTVDIRSCNTISLMAKKAKLLTTHPAASYELTTGAENNHTLTIHDPEAFWSISKYLVVRVW